MPHHYIPSSHGLMAFLMGHSKLRFIDKIGVNAWCERKPNGSPESGWTEFER